MNNARDPRALTALAAERLMHELAAAVARNAERDRIHMLAAEALLFGGDPDRVRDTAGLNDLELRLVDRLRQEFAADEAAVADETRKRRGPSDAGREGRGF